MRHDSGELGFLVSSEDQARIHVKEATWQSEGVDVVRVNNLDRKRHLRIGITNYVLSQAIDVLGNNRIIDDLGLGFNLH